MRLTKKSEKFINAYEWNSELPTKTFVQLSMNKLGQLEDVEDDLGIDLITLYKALKNGFYYKHYLKGDIVFDDGTYNRISLYNNGISIDLDDGWFYFMYKDYGKTWALTKEELL